MHSSSRYRIIVAGSLSQAAGQLITARFGPSAVIDDSRRDTTVELAADQAALRALLTMLWDLGHEVAILQPSGGPQWVDK
jgi:hypothetical protein